MFQHKWFQRKYLRQENWQNRPKNQMTQVTQPLPNGQPFHPKHASHGQEATPHCMV
jgi:hypothetical protein